MEPKTVTIPLVGGPGHGRTVLAVIGPDGRPPLTHPLIADDSLAAAATYELEATDTDETPWRYKFRQEDGKP
jgi:hypothetical protein